MLISIFASSFIFGIAAVVSPGPVSTAILSQTPRRGWTVGPLIATGHSFLEFIFILLIFFGMTAGLNSPLIQIFIATFGGILIIYMGASMLKGVMRSNIQNPGISHGSKDLNSGQLIRLGMITTLSSPFWYAWWVTSVPAYLNQQNIFAPAGLAAFYLGHISADYTWNTILSTVVTGGKKWITDKVYNTILALCGIFFIYLGINFLNEAIRLYQIY